MPPVDHQERANTRMWGTRGLVREYATTALRPAEEAVLERFAGDLGGRVLEVGCGAGRVTAHMARLSPDVHAFDVSPDMVAAARAACPEVTFSVADLRDLTPFDDAGFDAVALWCNVADVLGHDERRRALAGLARMLRPGGLLVLCTHNLAAAPGRRRPTDLPHDSARQFLKSAAGLPVTLYNHHRLARHEQSGDGWAVLNDEAHRFRALHYYVDRVEQERALDAAGFELLEIVDRSGAALAPGEPAPDSQDLHYVARRRA